MENKQNKKNYIKKHYKHKIICKHIKEIFNLINKNN